MALDAKAPPEIETAVAALTRIRADAQTVREAASRLPNRARQRLQGRMGEVDALASRSLCLIQQSPREPFIPKKTMRRIVTRSQVEAAK